MQDVLAHALEQYRRQLMIAQANAAYAALREDADAWQEVQREREIFEYALSDGIEDDPYPL
jgi:adenine C2-methylase RlmN of 23S rRNA A2503 and tRNA A37